MRLGHLIKQKERKLDLQRHTHTYHMLNHSLVLEDACFFIKTACFNEMFHLVDLLYHGD